MIFVYLYIGKDPNQSSKKFKEKLKKTNNVNKNNDQIK